MGSLSIWHWIIVIAVVLLLFGRGKISDLMGDVAQGIKAFKKGMSEDDTKAAEAKPEPAKTIDHQAAAAAAPKTETERARCCGSVSVPRGSPGGCCPCGQSPRRAGTAAPPIAASGVA